MVVHKFEKMKTQFDDPEILKAIEELEKIS